MSEFYTHCVKCGDPVAATEQSRQSQTGRRGFVCDICHQAENDFRRYEETGEFSRRNIRLNRGGRNR